LFACYKYPLNALFITRGLLFSSKLANSIFFQYA